MAQQRISFYDQIARNKLKSFFLILSVFVVLMLFGIIIGYVAGPTYFTVIMIISIIFSLTYILISYYNADKIALAAVNAKHASQRDYPMYHNIVEGLCLASGIPKPGLYVMENKDINAFASGRDPQHAVVSVTTGALEKLNKQELEGVLAHELSHVANYDIRFMTLTAVLVGMVAIISEIFLRSLFWGAFSDDENKGKAQIIFIVIGILFAILAPIAVTLVQLAISRKREYMADASGVKFIRSPTGLISALKKISAEQPSLKSKRISKAVAPLFISNPFKTNGDSLWSTHPSLKNRISILERM